MTLQGCQILNVAPAEGRLGSSPIEVTPPADPAYPRLSAVPPRPQLSYPVEQRRAVVEGLISDRENARYTGQTVRYRTGLSDLPPPPRPTPSPVETAQAIVQPRELPAPPTTDAPIAVIEDDGLSDDSARTLSESEAELDDGSLNDFIRDLVRDTGPSEEDAPILMPVPGATAAPGAPAPASQPAEPAATSPEAEPQGPIQRFVGWLGGLFRRGEGATAAEPVPTQPPPASTDDASQASPDEAPQAAAEQAAEPDEPERGVQESARPPASSLPMLPLAPAQESAPEPPESAALARAESAAPADAPSPGPARPELQPPIVPSPPAPRAGAPPAE